MKTVSFAQLGVSAPVCAALQARNITSPFHVQQLVLEDALAGLDVLVKSPTGSGKTLAFAIPLVERTSSEDKKPSALILVPTRELAVQVAEEITTIAAARGLKVALAYGGVPIPTQVEAAKNAQLLVATPGRLIDLIERRLINLASVKALVLDEADRMLDMGFKPQVDRIVKMLPEDRQTMFFSATLDGEVGEIARAYTVHAARYSAELPDERKQGQIDHRFVAVSETNKLDTLVTELQAAQGLALVFVRTKRGADNLAGRLARSGIKALAMHGDMGQRQREKALERFAGGQTSVLVATEVAARGIDIDDITHVVNYDPPEEPANYTHRVGRTGRAGRNGTAITLVLPDQQAEVSRIAALAGVKDAYANTGMTVARPRLVYNGSRGGRGRRRW